MTEVQFESELTDYLSSESGKIGIDAEESVGTFLSKGVMSWKYEKEIKTTEQLWDNFKKILEKHNQDTLEYPLSVVEFNQVKRIISDLKTPYQAGQFLYGLNGVSQIEIDLDDGRHVFLTEIGRAHV